MQHGLQWHGIQVWSEKMNSNHERYTAGSWSENKTANLRGGGFYEQDDESKKALANLKQNCTVAPRVVEADLCRSSWQLQDAMSRKPLLSWQLCSLWFSVNCTLRKPRASNTGLHGGSGAAGVCHLRQIPANQQTGLLAFIIYTPILSPFFVLWLFACTFSTLFFFCFPLPMNTGWQEGQISVSQHPMSWEWQKSLDCISTSPFPVNIQPRLPLSPSLVPSPLFCIHFCPPLFFWQFNTHNWSCLEFSLFLTAVIFPSTHAK